MSQQNLEILEYSLAPQEDLLSSGYSLAPQENFISPGEEFVFSEYSRAPEEDFISPGEEFVFPDDYLALEDYLPSEGFLASEGSLDSEYPSNSEASLALEYSRSPEYSIFLSETNSEDFLASSNPIFLQEANSEDFLASSNPISVQEANSRDSLTSSNPIFLQEANSGDSLTSSNPISVQERTALDPLTGMANNAVSNGIFNGMFNGYTVNALRQPELSINLSTGIPNHALVTTTVKVELTPLVKFLIQLNLVDFTLQSNVWGIDGRGWFQGGADDYLFGFPSQEITGDGTYSFSRIVPRGWLNEDHILFNHDDEIQGRFNLVSSDNAFPLNLGARSGIIRGYF